MSQERVDDDDLEPGDDLLLYRDGERFTGIAVDRFPDGSLWGETEYREGIQDGLSRTYWPDGVLRREIWNNYGVRVRERWWHENGRIAEDLWIGGPSPRRHYRCAEDGTVLEATYGPES